MCFDKDKIVKANQFNQFEIYKTYCFDLSSNLDHARDLSDGGLFLRAVIVPQCSQILYHIFPRHS